MTKRQTLKKHRHYRPKGVKRRSFERVYWPYLPVIGILILALAFSGLASASRVVIGGRVMAYATSMSVSGLLNETNAERIANGQSSLAASGQLIAAAQNKANDMATRDYWSHNTPEGNPPWIFVDAQGYEYFKVGENLATGYSTEAATVDAWMASPSHRANMLDNAYSEVGFGYANIADYTAVGGGPMTIIVAFYGKPQVAGATTPAPPASPPPAVPAAAPPGAPAPPSPVSAQTAGPPGASEPAPPAAEKKTPPPQEEQPVNTAANLNSEPPSKSTSQIQIALSDSRLAAPAAALAAAAMLAAGGLWVARHSLRLHRAVIKGEAFVMHHPVIDVGLLAVLAAAYLLNQTAGLIR